VSVNNRDTPGGLYLSKGAPGTSFSQRGAMPFTLVSISTATGQFVQNARAAFEPLSLLDLQRLQPIDLSTSCKGVLLTSITNGGVMLATGDVIQFFNPPSMWQVDHVVAAAAPNWIKVAARPYTPPITLPMLDFSNPANSQYLAHFL
jgi:hypothetical protein